MAFESGFLNSCVTKKIDKIITISVEQYSGKKTAVKFAWTYIFFLKAHSKVRDNFCQLKTL